MVASWVNCPELRSLKKGAPELRGVWFLVAAKELGKNPSLGEYEVKHMYAEISVGT